MEKIALITDEEFDYENFAIVLATIALVNNGQVVGTFDFNKTLLGIQSPRQVIVI